MKELLSIKNPSENEDSVVKSNKLLLVLNDLMSLKKVHSDSGSD